MTDSLESLKRWHDLLEQGIITQEEYEIKKCEILGISPIPKQDFPQDSNTSTATTKPNEPEIVEKAEVQEPSTEVPSNKSKNYSEKKDKEISVVKSVLIAIGILALFGAGFWYFVYYHDQGNFVIDNIGDTILYTPFEGIENSQKNSYYVAVPFVMYRNGNYEDPPIVTEPYGSAKEREQIRKDSDLAREVLRPFVQSGKELYLLRNGRKDITFPIERTEMFGYSDGLLYSGVLPELPAYKILTSNPKVGTNNLREIKDMPILQPRYSPEGEPFEDRLLDKVDIDGDGIPEIIYECDEYEGVYYTIYSNKNGSWKLVYEGGYQGY